MIYAQNKDYTLYKGMMQEELLNLEDNSIDSVVTDPPYELGFMGKSWDSSGVAFQKETWQHCLRVLKPGGYLLAFGGSRTFHRIACAIEDAGFEIRDTIMWLYGCLSEDTDILTSKGWRNKNNIKIGDEIYSLDLDKNILIKNNVRHVFNYPYDGEMINLKNSNTDQLLTPNHHCIVDDKVRTRIKGESTHYTNHDYWHYKDAWSIRSGSVKLPIASTYNGQMEIGNLFSELLGWIVSEGHYHKDTNAISIYQSSVNSDYVSRIRYLLGKLHIIYSEYEREREYKDKKYTEYQFYIGEKSVDFVNKIKELCPEKKLNWGLLELSRENKEFLLKGLCQGDGDKATNSKFGFSSFNQKDTESLEIFQVLLHMTDKQGWINENKSSCSIHSNPTTELQAKHFSDDRYVAYSGEVWCIETEIGNFIARRNGKVFITGNSGFPKSMNIGLAIDKKNGVESIDTGITSPNARPNSDKTNTLYESGTVGKDFTIKKATNEWDGWGTCLKPSFEPIIVARKPCEESCVENVIKYGVGGINIDECRVETNDDLARINKTDNGMFGVGNNNNNNAQKCKELGITYGGRFPANVITDGSDEVAQGFPNTKGNNSNELGKFGFCFGDNRRDSKPMAHGYVDEGSAMRYFYCAKASKKDRDEGLESFEIRTKVFNGKSSQSSLEMKDVEERFTTEGKNIHTTVKPCSLMQYLVRLVSPKGATILDPFMGSGSTGKAAMFENRERNANYKFIGVEMTDEYLPICKARIDFANNYDDVQVAMTNTEDNETKVKTVKYKAESLF